MWRMPSPFKTEAAAEAGAVTVGEDTSSVLSILECIQDVNPLQGLTSPRLKSGSWGSPTGLPQGGICVTKMCDNVTSENRFVTLFVTRKNLIIIRKNEV